MPSSTHTHPQAQGSRLVSTPSTASAPLSAYAPCTTPVPLVRPWSLAPAPRRALGVRGYLVGVLAGLVLGLPVGSALPADASPEPVSPAASQLADPGDPPCGFDVYRSTLTVTSLTARGRVRVWLGDRLVRDGVRIKPGQTVSFRLRKRHSATRFTVSVVRGPLTQDESLVRNVSRCESA